jgi:hypothetical protein
MTPMVGEASAPAVADLLVAGDPQLEGGGRQGAPSLHMHQDPPPVQMAAAAHHRLSSSKSSSRSAMAKPQAQEQQVAVGRHQAQAP